mgnify:CR=1 FL=1
MNSRAGFVWATPQHFNRFIEECGPKLMAAFHARKSKIGMAQLLGYVNTKAMAIRLMLKNRQTETAESHLLQLEEAAQARRYQWTAVFQFFLTPSPS